MGQTNTRVGLSGLPFGDRGPRQGDDEELYKRRRAERRKPNAPIHYLSRSVSLLESGYGPVVVGVAQDAVMGKWLLQQFEDRAKREAR